MELNEEMKRILDSFANITAKPTAPDEDAEDFTMTSRQYYLISVCNNNFYSYMLVYGTEREILSYLAAELGQNYAYIPATKEQIASCRSLGMKCYLAPQL